MTIIRRFAEEMADGDLVALRLGTAQVVAVGRVVGDYQYHPEFGDVDGWDLEHVRRVRWIWSDLKNPKGFPAYSMKFGDTTQRLRDGEVHEWVRSLDVDLGHGDTGLPELPEVLADNDASIESISNFLFHDGVASTSVNRLASEMGELIRIANWYKASPNKPSEHETVAYLIAPLLRALGWTPQKMAIEWNYVDVALFDRLPRVDENLCVVVEAKKMDRSCLTAIGQASGYALSRSNCKRLIVTDGIRYAVFVDGSEEPYAYINLTRLKRRYPIYGECLGAHHALLAMAPEWR